MAFIQAPSYKPPQQYDMWGGIADIFGDIVSMRESKRQRERQEVADAQRLASHTSQQEGRSLANQLKREQLDTYQKSVENLEWDPQNYDALINQAKKTGNWGSLAGVLPKNVVTNLKGLTDYQNKIDLGLQRAIDSKNKQAYDALRIKKLEADNIYTNKINELNLATGGARKRTAESAANVAEATEQPKIDYTTNQNESARIRKENALRTQQASIQRGQDLSTIAGQNFRPVDRASVPRGGNVVRIPGVSDQSQQTIYNKQFLDALNRRSAESPGTYTPERRAELLKNLTVADVAAGKGTWEIMKDKSGLSRANLTKSLADSMKSYVTGIEDIDANEFSASEQKTATNNIMRVVEQVHRENPNLDPYDIYMNILSSPHNFLTIKDRPGFDDVIPMNYSNIMKNLNLTGPNAQNQQGNQEQATNRSTSPNKTTEQREIDFQKMYRIYQEKMGGKLSYEAWRQTL